MVAATLIKARTRPLLPVVVLLLAFGVSGATANQPTPVEIGITTHLGDRQQFAAGDVLSFLLSLDRDAYVYVFYRDADANLLQLLPNRRFPGHFFEAGFFMPVPDDSLPFQFEVAPPYGEESIFAYASDNGELSFAGTPLDNGLILLRDHMDAIADRIESGSTKLFGRAELTISTQPAP